MVGQIVQLLQNIDINWNMDEVLAKLPAEGLRLAQTVGKRKTFEAHGGQRYSFYFSESGKISSVEATAEVFYDADSLSENDYQKVISEYFDKYQKVVDEVSAILLEGRTYRTAGGMPHERDAIRLMLWNLGASDLMVELKHEDRHVPIRLVLTLSPIA